METHIKIVIASKNLLLCKHPLIFHNLSIIRDKTTSSELFRTASKRIAHILFLNAVDNLPTVSTEIETPLMKMTGEKINEKSDIIIAPILRAGLAFSEVVHDILPMARVHHIGLYRDEKTLAPVSYYNNLPKSFSNPENTFIYIPDPMLATGGSAVAAIKLFIDLNIPENNIRFISLISAPEGIKKIHDEYPNIKIITAAIDINLNQFGYILPGLGDAGDRTFNTVY